MTTPEPEVVSTAEDVAAAAEPDAAPVAVHGTVDVVEHHHLHGPGEHDEPVLSKLDRSYLRSVGIGYLGGVVAIFVFMLINIHLAAPDLSGVTKVAVAIGVAFWIGIMGGVVAVGMWARRNEEQLHH